MPLKMVGLRVLVAIGISSVFLLHKEAIQKKDVSVKSYLHSHLVQKEGEDEEKEAEYTNGRLLQELRMLRNPVTGRIPANFHEIELAAADKIPDKNSTFSPLFRANGITNQNTYQNIGPNNIAGRSRTLAFDRRNSNIMLTGGTTGGIFRSTDGGVSWNFVSPEEDIRSATAIVQDPSNPDTWYCGTGEAYYVQSQADISHGGTFGHGVYKSINNGQSWTKLTSTQGNENIFDSPFDLVHRLAVHPTTGYIYAAVHRRIMRSKDGGQTWEIVLAGTTTANPVGGVTDIIIPSGGSKIFAAVTGGNPDRSFVGVWESATGDPSSWKRIAGGTAGQADSIAGWQPYGKWDRVVLALNNANTNLYVLYKNGNDASGTNPKPEADLYNCNISSGNSATYTWTNLSAYVPDEPNFNEAGIDPYTTQFNGYNMSITPKPDNDSILFIGGTVLERVDLRKNAAKKFTRIGGYGKGFFPNDFIYPDHHPDIHGIYFLPGNNDRLFTASDGGIHRTSTSVMADTVRWTPRDSGLQTIQYQFVNINPDVYPDSNFTFVIGGAQDNGTLINLNVDPTGPSSLTHDQIGGGDGASSAISSFTKIGNLWKQHLYFSVVQGTVYRFDISLDVSKNTLKDDAFNDITPTGLGDKGQFLTLFLNDPDSTEHLYYNSHNKLYRTTTASKVTSATWTELTGVGSTIPSNENLSTLAISKKYKGSKYLFMGTDTGHVYRLKDPNITGPATAPINITPTGMTEGSYVAGISVNPRSADTVLVVVSNYDAGSNTIQNIFWTGNATAATPTWQVLDGALEPLSIQSCAIVVKTTGVEYYVGTSVGLYSTTSISGNSTPWVKEGSGMLRRAIVRSLVNRQKDNTLVVGTHGNGAFIAGIGDAVVLDNITTGINDPILNDKNFIRAVYPTLTNSNVQYTIGNMYTVKRLSVKVTNMKGQLVYKNDTGYQSGAINVSLLAAGNYLLVINSDDGKYRYVQKFIKQ